MNLIVIEFNSYPGVLANYCDGPECRFIREPSMLCVVPICYAISLAFYCFISAASLHRTYLRNDGGGAQALLLRLSYRTQAVRLLQEALNRGGPLTDDLLVSVASLAAHCPTTTGEFTRGQTISKSPLATAQSLDFHGSVSLGTEHSKALQRLITQRGGIGTVRMTGLAQAIA